MKKVDLLTALSVKYFKVLTATEQKAENGIKVYSVIAYDKKADSLRRHILNFYVENEGQANEGAYWNSAEPKTVTVSFGTEISDYIEAKITAGIIKGAFVDDIDERKEIACGRAIVEVAGSLVEKKILMDKDSSGDLQHTVIG